MNWFHENRFLGSLLLGAGLWALGAGYFLFSAKSNFNATSEEFQSVASELNRLERLNPFPNNANLLRMKTQAKEAGLALDKLKQDLKARVLPATPLAPNEFQASLRQSVTSLTEKARANKVKLPDNFFLGFEEYSAALPDNTEAPLLGQQLAQIELLLNILIDARVDALISFRRIANPEQIRPATAPKPSPSRKGAESAAGPNLIERKLVEATFFSTPAAGRRVLNQIAGASQQFFIIRTLHVQNEKDKGPPRQQTAAMATTNPTTASTSPAAKPTPGGALQFIVGTERLQTSANIELIKFNF